MASEQLKTFREIMDSLEESGRSFNEFKEESRKLVLRTMSFAVDTTDFTTDAQDDELELQDREELHEEWKNTNKQMEICLKRADTVQDLIKASFEKLSAAKGKASDATICGIENSFTSCLRGVLCHSGAGAMACIGTVATGGLALPFIAGACLLEVGTIVSMMDALKQCQSGQEFLHVQVQLCKLFLLVEKRAHSMKKQMNDLLHESSEMLDKSTSITNQPRLSRSGYFKLRCRRLGEQSERLKARCIQYISDDDEGLFEINGPMAELSIKDKST